MDHEQQPMLEMEKLKQAYKRLLSERDQALTALDDKKNELENEQQQHATMKKELESTQENLSTLESKSVQLKLIVEQTQREIDRLGLENAQFEEHFAVERAELQKEHFRLLNEKQVNISKLLLQLQSKEELQTQCIQEISEKLHGLEDSNNVCVLPPEQHLQDSRKLQVEIEQLLSGQEIEVTKLKTEIEQQEKWAVQCKEQTERLSRELEETKKSLESTIQHSNEKMMLKEDHSKQISELRRTQIKMVEEEVKKRVDRQEAVSTSRLRELRNDIQRLIDEGKKKDSTIAQLREDIKKRDESADKAGDKLRKIEQIEGEFKCMQAERRNDEQRFHVKLREIESLKNKLHDASDELATFKTKAEEQSKLAKESLDEENQKLVQALTQNEVLQSENDELQHENVSLRERFEQLKFEANMKKDLAESSSCVDPCESPMDEPQVYLH